MIVSLFAMLLVSAQPAPVEEPVVTETEMEVEVATPVVAVDAAVDAQTEVAPVAPEPVEEEEVAAAEPEEEIVCRRRVIPAERIGQRMRTVRDCRPASEWQTRRRGS